MTDTATPTDMGGLYEMLKGAIQELDEKIDSWNPETGIRNQFLKELVAENGDTTTQQTNKLATQLSEMDERKRYSLYYGILEGLRNTFKGDFDKWLTVQLETMPKPEKVEVSEDERKEVTSKRSEYYAKIKQVKELAESFGFPGAETWTMPSVRRAGSGKRGKRALSLYSWAIDGVEVGSDDNTPAGVAKLLDYEKAGDFTKDLKEQTVVDDEGKSGKLNTSKPPREFEVTVRGKVITASRITDEDVDDSDEDEENGEEDE